MYILTAYHYDGEFAFSIDFDTEEEAFAYVKELDGTKYDIEIECPNGDIINA